MTSIFDKDIIEIISKYSAEEYIVTEDKTEIVTSIPLCNVCLCFCDFKQLCKNCYLNENNINNEERVELEERLQQLDKENKERLPIVVQTIWADLWIDDIEGERRLRKIEKMFSRLCLRNTVKLSEMIVDPLLKENLKQMKVIQMRLNKIRYIMNNYN